PNTGCSALYEIGAEQVGWRMLCRECGTLLIVEADGLRLADQPGTPSDGPAASRGNEPAPERPRRSPSLVGPNTFKKPGALSEGGAFTLLLGSGAVLMILFVFLPLIDQAKIWRRKAALQAAEKQAQRLQEDSDGPTRESAERNWR